MSVFQARVSRGAGGGTNTAEYSEVSGAVRWGGVARLAALLVLAVGLSALAGMFGGGERLRALVEQSGPWAPLTYIAAKAGATIVAPFSGVPLKAASGALFGLVGGIFYSVCGDVIGGCVCFLAARFVGSRTAGRLAGEGRKGRVDTVIDRGLGGWRELLFFRVTCPAVYNLLSYAAGSTRLPFWQYLAVTALGGVIHTSILVAVGASVALGWEERVAAYGGIVVLSLVALFVVRRLRGTRGT